MDAWRMRQSQDGAAGTVVLGMLLVALAAAGTWNYLRNVRAEEQVFRPYASYSDANLTALQEAYGAEAEQLRARYERARGTAAGVRDRELLGEQVREFERVQRVSHQVRELGAQLSEREAALRDLDDEQAQRERDRDALAVFLRRLLTLPT